MADAPLIEGEDYVMEGGFMVFTAAWHLKRGACCGNGCRNCPYLPPHTAGARTVSPDI